MTVFTLKMVAIITMTLDHLFKIIPDITKVLPDFRFVVSNNSISVLGLVFLLGRISFPVFAFCVATGAVHTKNMKKYLTRLFIFALISELPFDYAFYGGFSFARQNVMWTFFFGVLAVHLYTRLKSTPLEAYFAVFATYAVCFLCKTDYYIMGVPLIFMMYAVKNKPLKILVVIGIICAYYLYHKGLYLAIRAQNETDILNLSLNLFATLSSVIFIALYNGKKGAGFKWFFYMYYPLHLVVLTAIEKL